MSTVSEKTSEVDPRRQKRMGPAPFASFEDLSDEVRSRLDSPDDKITSGSVVRLPGIREDVTPCSPSLSASKISVEASFLSYPGISLVGACVSPTKAMPSPKSTSKSNLQTPRAPRIDISRASSSSHHDSKDSSPDREIIEERDSAGVKLGLGFKEDGALDLRLSTEELDFQDPEERKKTKSRPTSPSFLVQEDTSFYNRKDSLCSEIGLLCISGRTSRISSIGSQGSAHSRLSNVSHLSALSGDLTRSPSPHKMMVETSFCGTRTPPTRAVEDKGTKPLDAEDLEKLLLARKHDPTKAIVAEGISIGYKLAAPEKPFRKGVQNQKSDITIKVDKPVTLADSASRPPKRIVSESGVEYIYIPLKGPLPLEPDEPTAITTQPRKSNSKLPLREVKSANVHSKTKLSQQDTKTRSQSAVQSPVGVKRVDEPKYIRIRLKPEHLYESFDKGDSDKPATLDLNEIRSETQCIKENVSPLSTPNVSPNLTRHILKDTKVSCKSPSPLLSRKNSFASLFKSKEAITSPESPTFPGGVKRKNTLTGLLKDAGENILELSRSRSKSRDHDKISWSNPPSSSESIDSKTKQKSVLSLFKGKPTGSGRSSPSPLPKLEGITKVEFTFNDPLVTANSANKNHVMKYYEEPLKGQNSVRIPLHSPTQSNECNILHDCKTSSQDSQETVIEAISTKINAVVEPLPQSHVLENSDSYTGIMVQSSKGFSTNTRQSSTSSENVVFSTKIGNNEVFTTKLPKDRITKIITKVEIAHNGHIPKEKSLDRPISSSSVHENLSESVEVQKIGQPSNPVKEVIEEEVPKELKRTSTISLPADDERNNSSESERDSEVSFPRKEKMDLKLEVDYLEPERKGLFLQESFEDELPYIPTTLPQERSAAVPIVPICQRSTFEMKTCPIERPRSTTPINPSTLEEYCEDVIGAINAENITKTIEKLKICLPRVDSSDKVKSPRKAGGSGNWFDFAEKGMTSGRRSSNEVESPPPPLPPKGIQKEWINFEEIPEKRKLPKRIQTIPSRGHIDVPESVVQDNIVYNYVNPDECKCECHELRAKEKLAQNVEVVNTPPSTIQEDELPLLAEDTGEEEKSMTSSADRLKLDVIADRQSLISDSSADLSTSADQPTSIADGNLRTPFTSDLGCGSNRSSIISQDETHSPDSESPNAFPRNSYPV